MNFERRTYFIMGSYAILLILATKIHIDSLDGIISDYSPEDEVFSALSNYRLYMISTFSFFLLLLAVEAFFVHRPSMHIMKSMLKSVDELSKGETKAHIDSEILGLDNEWGELARAFEGAFLTLKLKMDGRELTFLPEKEPEKPL
jgi:signal transduction histidine kinase